MFDDPFPSRVKQSGSTKKSMQETPPSNHPRNPERSSWRHGGLQATLHPSLLPNHRSSREDQSEWAQSIRVWSSMIYHRLMQKRSHLRKDPVNSRDSSTNQWTYRSKSFIQFLSKDHSRKSRTLSVGNNSSGATFQSEGFISCWRNKLNLEELEAKAQSAKPQF